MFGLNEWARGIDLTQIVEWLSFALAALIAISVHESAHALSALWLGDDTAKRMGRISLNPLRHLDVYGFFMMVLVHFGWAKPVPVNPYRMTKIKSPKVGMALTAAAGPISNVLLALLFGLAFYICVYAGGVTLWRMLWYDLKPAGWLYYLTKLLEACFVLNTGLAVFNLIPISPLDGSKVLAVLLPDRAHEWLMRYERYGFLVLMALLFTGVLDKPLSFLQGGLIDGISAVTEPLARTITGFGG